jgi:hypothetical protein
MWFFALPGLIRGAVSIVPTFVWKALAIVIIALSIFFYGQIKGKQSEHAKCEAAAAQAQTAANDQDLQAEKETHANDLEILNNLKMQKQVDDVNLEKFKAQLAKRPAGSKCIYDKSNGDPDAEPDAGSLRDNGGRPAKTGAGNKKSPRPPVLPAARPSSASPRGS